jgi:signal transduction histidine kinase
MNLGEDLLVTPSPNEKTSHPYLKSYPRANGNDVLAQTDFKTTILQTIARISGNLREFLAIVDGSPRDDKSAQLRHLAAQTRPMCEEIKSLDGDDVCEHFGIKDGDLIYIIRWALHDLRSYFRNVPGSMDIVANGEDENDNRLNALRGMANSFPAAIKTVEGMFAFEEVRDVDLSEVIDIAVRRIEKMVTDYGVSFKVIIDKSNVSGLDLRVEVGVLHFLRIVRNIAINAYEAGADNFRIVVEISDEHAVLKLQNDGPPIPIEHLSSIFAPHFSRNKRTDRTLGGGEGIGLTGAQTALEHMGGHFGETKSSVSVEDGGIGGPQFEARFRLSPICACAEASKASALAITNSDAMGAAAKRDSSAANPTAV